MELRPREEDGYGQGQSMGSSASAKIQTGSQHERKVKLMCSFGGKVLLRPSDRKLRYVGGETKMISVARYTHYEPFLRKLVDIYGTDITLKYQLPEEDLDTLVTVSSDEDLEIMMEERDKLEAFDGRTRLRVFVFPPSELEDVDLSDLADTKTAEQKYVDAVNTVVADVTSWKLDDFVFKDSSSSLGGMNDYTHGFAQQEVLAVDKFGSNSHHHSSEEVTPVTQAKQDFLDLERVDSADSSTSSQQEFSYPFSQYRLFPSSQTQVEPVQNVYNVYVEDKFDRVPQMYAMESGHDGNMASPLPMAVLPHQQATEIPPVLVHKEVSLSPGTVLLKQLQVDHLQEERLEDKYLQGTQQEISLVTGYPLQQDLQYHQPMQGSGLDENYLQFAGQEHSLNTVYPLQQAFLHHQLMQGMGLEDNHLQGEQKELSPSTVYPLQESFQLHHFMQGKSFEDNYLHGAEQELSINTGYPLQEAFQHHQFMQDVTWQTQPLYDPLTGLGIGTPVVGQADSTENTLHAQEEIFPLHAKELSPFFFPNFESSPPSGAVRDECLTSQVPLTTFTSTNYTEPFYIQKSGDTYEAMVLHPLPPFHESPALGFQNATLSNTQVEVDEHSVVPADLLYGFGATQDDMRAGLPGNTTHSYSETQLVTMSPPQFASLMQEYSPGWITVEETYPSTSSYSIPAASQSEALHLNTNTDLHIVSSTSLHGDPHSIDKAHNMSTLPQSGVQIMQETRIADIIPTSSSVSCFENIVGSAHSKPTVSSFEHVVDGETHLQLSQSLARDSSDDALNLLPSEMMSNVILKGSRAKRQDNNMPYITQEIVKATKNVKSLASVNQGEASSAPASLVAESDSISIVTTPFAVTWNTVIPETLQGEEGKDPQEVEIPTMEKRVTFVSTTVDNEELNTPEPVVDRHVNAAVLAEAEAIAHGLQTIRNCDLEELRELGSGTFGTVYHGKWRGTDVAIKRIKASVFMGRPAERERLIADFWREACLLGQLHHPNVVAFYGVVPDGPGGTLATVTEYMVNGSLKQVLLKNDRTLDRRKRLLIAMDAAFGMEYLHGKNVVHFDMKCENLLVNLRDTQRPICKVGDLGLSKVKQQTMISGGVRGTLPWMAPELLNGSSSMVCEKVDIFSFGIVLWELLTGEEPYANMHYGAIIGGIVNNTLRPPVPRWCDPAWRLLMERCWSAEPSERPSFSEIVGSLRAMQAALQKAAVAAAGT